MVGSGQPRVRVSKEFADLLKEHGEKNIMKCFNSEASLAQKHVAIDAKSIMIANELRILRELQASLKDRFEQEKSQYVLDIENENQKLKKEIDHLRGILGLHSSGGGK